MRYSRLRSFGIPLMVIGLLAAGLMLGSCNDNPTSLGSQYLPNNVEFHTYTFRPEDIQVVSGIAAAYNISSEGHGAILVGRASDSSIAHSLITFTTVPPAFLKGTTAKPIVKAGLVVRTFGYHYGDSTRQTSFDVVVLDQQVTSTLQWSEDLATRIANAPVLGTFDRAIADTSETDTIPLDPVQTAAFVKEYLAEDSSVVKSLALRAHNDARNIISIAGASFNIAEDRRPTLHISTADTTVDIRSGVSTWITKPVATFGNDTLSVAGGAPVRTLIRFNLDSIPATATIHQAKLTLHVDPSGTRYGSAGATTYLVGYAARELVRGPDHFLNDIDSNRAYGAFRTALDSANFTDVFQFNSLATLVTDWLRNKRGVGTVSNNGIVVALNRGGSLPDLETASSDRLKFYGMNAPESLRPNLIVIYSLQTNAK